MPLYLKSAKELRAWSQRLSHARQVPEQKGGPGKLKTTGGRGKRRSPVESQTWQCWDCKWIFHTEADYERHRDSTRHHRYDWPVE